MSQAKPELAGVKVRRRKKDLKAKAKYEPEEFCDALVDELKEAEGNFEMISKKLEASADPLDFKRYVEPLFDVLFTGGMLDAGGSHDQEAELSPFSVFSAEESPASIKKFVEVFNLLIRRYRYLQTGFEDSIGKMLRLLNRFSPSESNKLAMCFTYIFISQMAPMSLLTVLFLDHLVKEGHSLEFITIIFKTYLSEQSLEQLSSSLKKNGLDDRLLEFFPQSKRTEEFLGRHFNSHGLGEIVSLYEKRHMAQVKTEFRETLKKAIQEELPFPDVSGILKQSKGDISDVDLISLVWEALMESIDWSRRNEQCEEQATKAVKEWGKLFKSIVNSAKTELSLILRLQLFCYEDSRLTRAFSKLVILFYKMDILSEAAVVYWFQKGANSKGKAVFTQQLQPFIKWLNETEEESGDEN